MKALLPDDPRWIGPHHMIAVIGRGGMGRVLLGRTPTGKLVAVKQIHRALTDDLEFRARFQRELATARQLSGVFTAAVVDSDLESETPWLATEYVPAPDLATVIAGCGPLPLSGLRLLATGLAATLIEVHRAVLVHRNLEPGNVLLAPEGPRIIDFGVASPRNAEDDPAPALFQAPEQAEGQPVTSAADIYAVGMLLALAATGVTSASPDLQAIPHSLRKLVESCLARDPAHRPSARQLLEQAERIPTESVWPQQVLEFIEAHRADAEWWASSGEQETRYRDQLARLAGRRRRTVGWAAAAAVGLLVAGGTVAALSGSAEDGHARPHKDSALNLSAAQLRLLDLCAVLDKAVAGKLGTRTGDPAATPEGGCATTVVDSTQRKVHYTFDIPDHAIGVDQLTPTGRTAAKAPILSAGTAGSACDTVVVAQSGSPVPLRMSAEQLDPAAAPESACAASEEALLAVVGQLTDSPPQRQLPPSSLLRLDPCAVLQDSLIHDVTGDPSDHQRTPHSCATVGHEGTVRVDLSDESRPDRGDWTYDTLRVGEFTAYVTGARTANDCDLSYLVRPTEKDNAEQLKITVSDLSNSPDACGKAEKLLLDAIPRLPK
ncbi:serine/threonine protein kinase [Nocardia yunnanensis]|uniref:Serine/threonine protein kinase n=1 Tax=Nocardia yunnanensis TaxID=2382165 RepID=A0A386ZGT9_9NOCA|nr:serine/threonine-protein kinase [Nocardia yunnanensis]AYF76610.1 serine/threonine protein kinase [Nocardia yunnanensis]